MKCARPLAAWRSKTRSPGGGWPVTFRLSDAFKDKQLDLPCGRCMQCRINKAEEWAIRLEHENASHEDSQFLTLTYEKMPDGGSLQPRDMQLFLKRLRKHVAPKEIRFYQVGEYGDQGGRPHHHLLMFGHRFTDCTPIRTGDLPLSTSPTLERLWGHGFVTIGEVTPKSIRYVASYITKRLTGPAADKFLQGRHPEYATMSRNPGIGVNWALRFAGDFKRDGSLTLRNGARLPLPRLYRGKLQENEQAQLAWKARIAAIKDKRNSWPQRQAREKKLIAKQNHLRKGSL